MLQELKKYLPKRLQNPRIPETASAPAYDIWAENYDNQPGNLMLDLDEKVFSNLLADVDMKGKNVADVGCGTGRHWQKMMDKQPGALTGFDVSGGMLNRLKEKFPKANTHLIINGKLPEMQEQSFDTQVSTLTMAHIEDAEDALLTWCKLVKPSGDILITDFHPDALDKGGQRTFKHNGRHIAIRNYVHKVSVIKAVMALKNWNAVHEEQLFVDESVRHYYESQNAMHVYNKFKGMPIIYGLHFKHEG